MRERARVIEREVRIGVRFKHTPFGKHCAAYNGVFNQSSVAACSDTHMHTQTQTNMGYYEGTRELSTRPFGREKID